MKYEKGKLYRHMSALDTDLYIVKTQWQGEKRAIVKGQLYHRSLKVLFPVETYIINVEDFDKWEEVKA